MNTGKMKVDRVKKFNELMGLVEKYKKNQYE